MEQGSAKQIAREAATDWVNGLSVEQKSAIVDYTSEVPNYYGNINATLRGKSSGFDEGNAERAAHIHSALQRAVLPVDVTVYRRGGDTILGSQSGKSDAEIIGKSFRDRGFISTAMSKEAARPGNTMLRIKVPKGCHAANIETLSMAGSYEEELLIDKDQVFVITGIEYDGACRIVDVIMLKKN